MSTKALQAQIDELRADLAANEARRSRIVAEFSEARKADDGTIKKLQKGAGILKEVQAIIKAQNKRGEAAQAEINELVGVSQRTKDRLLALYDEIRDADADAAEPVVEDFVKADDAPQDAPEPAEPADDSAP